MFLSSAFSTLIVEACNFELGFIDGAELDDITKFLSYESSVISTLIAVVCDVDHGFIDGADFDETKFLSCELSDISILVTDARNAEVGFSAGDTGNGECDERHDDAAGDGVRILPSIGLFVSSTFIADGCDDRRENAEKSASFVFSSFDKSSSNSDWHSA